MGFEDLEDAIEEQDQEDDDEPETTMDATEFDTTTEETDDVQENSDDELETEPDLSAPAFEFDETDQNPLYARGRSWDQFDDMLDLELERQLRDRDLRDVPKREKHDAALRFAAEHPEEIADLIESERRDS